MTNIIHITDLQAPELDVYARLTEAQLKNRRNPDQGIFIAESHKVISHALDAGFEPISFLMEEKHITGQAAPLLQRCGGIPVYTGSRQLLSQLTGYELTRGILCAMRRPALPQASQVLKDAKRIAVLEGIVDPTNIGAIFRSAAALHMDGILLTPTCCDPLNRRAVRVSMGTVFQVPWARIGQSPADWPGEGLALLKESGFETAALALSHNSIPIDDPALKQAKKLALILGAEGDGLARETIEACDHTVLIPMSHGVDSLNVAAASAVAFWELRSR